MLASDYLQAAAVLTIYIAGAALLRHTLTRNIQKHPGEWNNFSNSVENLHGERAIVVMAGSQAVFWSLLAVVGFAASRELGKAHLAAFIAADQGPVAP